MNPNSEANRNSNGHLNPKQSHGSEASTAQQQAIASLSQRVNTQAEILSYADILDCIAIGKALKTR